MPDSFSVVGAAPLAGGVAEMKLYAGKVVGWEGPDGGERGAASPRRAAEGVLQRARGVDGRRRG